MASSRIVARMSIILRIDAGASGTARLLIGPLTTTWIFLPKSIGVVTGAVDDFADGGLHAFSQYDPARFVFVVVFAGFLAWQAFRQVPALQEKLG
jgi:hypothetical protein